MNTASTCVHCGEPIKFLRVTSELATDHPFRAEYQADGGWWVHASGLRYCAFGGTLAQDFARFLAIGNVKATPALCLEEA